MTRTWFGKTYTVTYDSSNPLSLLTQRRGSIWPAVFPYCLLNTILMATLHVLFAYGIKLDISGQGHRYMAFVVSFLLVSRVTTAVRRYDEAREDLSKIYRNLIQLVHTACIYSNRDDSLSGKEWRSEVTYKSLVFVRTSMAVLDFPSSGVKLMSLSELQGDVLEDLERNLPPTRWLHGARTEYEENFRFPTRLAYLLRKSIHTQELRLQPVIAPVAEGHMHKYINYCMDGVFGLHEFITTPVPFPLLQMTSTFLWFYIFTVPFALLQADERGIKSGIAHCLVIFIMTFGFIGMEYAAVQMDDPFGGDENDFNTLSMAEMVFEDAYLAVDDVDGAEWADKLRAKMNHEPLGEKHPTEYNWLLRRSMFFG